MKDKPVSLEFPRKEIYNNQRDINLLVMELLGHVENLRFVEVPKFRLLISQKYVRRCRLTTRHSGKLLLQRIIVSGGGRSTEWTMLSIDFYRQCK
jgi:hypothetical protein